MRFLPIKSLKSFGVMTDAQARILIDNLNSRTEG